MFLIPDRHALRRLRHDLALVIPGLPLTLFAALSLLPLIVVSAALSIAWVGVLLFPVTLALASAWARLDRARLRRWGIEVTTPSYRPRGRGAVGPLRLITDPRRWLDLAFEAIIALPVRLLTAGITIAWLAGAVGGLSWWAWAPLLPPALTPLPGQWALAMVVGLMLALSFPAMVRALALLDLVVTAPLLGGAVPGSSLRGTIPPPRSAEADARLRESAWTRMTIAFLAFVLVVVGWPVTAAVYGVHPSPAMLVALGGGAAALLAVRWPWAGLSLDVVAVAAMMLVTLPASSEASWPWPVTALLAHCLTLLVLAVLHRWYWTVSTWSAGALLTLVALLLTDARVMPGGMLRELMTNGVVLLAVSGGVLLLGITVRQWVLVTGEVERAQTLSAEEVRRRYELQERGRIARELHDVVAHSMSVITVQAGTAKFRLPGLDASTEQEFEDIAASSRQALGEMRSLLAILRTDEDLAEVPMPGLPDLEELLRTTRAAGAAITADLTLPEVPPTAGLTAYRVVQEALSNALRHARGAAIDVRVGTADGALVVEVTNELSEDPAESIPGSGLGLAGAQERVRALGGDVEAGATAEGGFRVTARIPIADPLPR
ncbi:sensor histidine kinase [Brachybacterium ginsengisoli]|uniref:histidine kinase n=1 Tax=Brachybacterium ginsengisoli TaxID=1331682 RepID=A0A291GYG2_9MICO|nr:histidine kinase [Brachybacterium ginsengisoli]ATG55250.1 sensor histidine kinase [Brachybacterium ginsengisoli]